MRRWAVRGESAWLVALERRLHRGVSRHEAGLHEPLNERLGVVELWERPTLAGEPEAAVLGKAREVHILVVESAEGGRSGMNVPSLKRMAIHSPSAGQSIQVGLVSGPRKVTVVRP